MEEGFAGLDLLKHRARVPVGFGPDGAAEGTADGEVPGLGQTRRALWDPDIGRAARPKKGQVGRVEGVGHRCREHGWQEAGLLLVWSQGEAVAGDVVEYVPNGVVAANAVSPTSTRGRGHPIGPEFARRVGKLSLRPRLPYRACAGDW